MNERKMLTKMICVVAIIFLNASVVPAKTLKSQAYVFDNNGNITDIISFQGSKKYEYDALDRLKKAETLNQQNSINAYVKEYSYSKTGNITTKDGGSYTYNSGHVHAPSGDGRYNYTYDNNGNLKTKTDGITSWEYSYDAENHLTRVTRDGVEVGKYWYDDTGKMIRKSEEGKETIYVNSMYEIRDNDSTDDIPGDVHTYYYALGNRIAEDSKDENGNDTTYYYHNDHLGGTNIVTKEDGVTVSETEYTPFGTPIESAASTKETSYKFTGKEYSGGTGLYYYEARWYDPELGMFITPDTLIPELYYSQSLNRYAYVENNPVKYVDPDGRFVVLGPVLLYAAIAAINVGSDYGLHKIGNYLTKPEKRKDYTVGQAVTAAAFSVIGAGAISTIGRALLPQMGRKATLFVSAKLTSMVNSLNFITNAMIDKDKATVSEYGKSQISTFLSFLQFSKNEITNEIILKYNESKFNLIVDGASGQFDYLQPSPSRSEFGDFFGYEPVKSTTPSEEKLWFTNTVDPLPRESERDSGIELRKADN